MIDLPNPNRVKKTPDATKEIITNGDFVEQGFTIKKIELRLYFEKEDKKLGKYSLITSFIETDKGSIEMIYDEGFKGNNPLNSSAKLLVEHLGISALILRGIVALSQAIDNQT